MALGVCASAAVMPVARPTPVPSVTSNVAAAVLLRRMMISLRRNAPMGAASTLGSRCGAALSTSWWFRNGLFRSRHRRGGQVQPHGGATAGAALRGDGAAVPLDDRTHQGQPQPAAGDGAG